MKRAIGLLLLAGMVGWGQERFQLFSGEYRVATTQGDSSEIAVFRIDTNTGEVCILRSVVIEQDGKTVQVTFWDPVSENWAEAQRILEAFLPRKTAPPKR